MSTVRISGGGLGAIFSFIISLAVVESTLSSIMRGLREVGHSCVVEVTGDGVDDRNISERSSGSSGTRI
jgi:hypothetical protein